MGASDDELTGIYVVWAVHNLKIVHVKLETFTQGAPRHADQFRSHKVIMLHFRVLNGKMQCGIDYVVGRKFRLRRIHDLLKQHELSWDRPSRASNLSRRFSRTC